MHVTKLSMNQRSNIENLYGVNTRPGCQAINHSRIIEINMSVILDLNEVNHDISNALLNNDGMELLSKLGLLANNEKNKTVPSMNKSKKNIDLKNLRQQILSEKGRTNVGRKKQRTTK
jgi:hypothetical protein